jgi:hypothetical protein
VPGRLHPDRHGRARVGALLEPREEARESRRIGAEAEGEAHLALRRERGRVMPSLANVDADHELHVILAG